MWTRACRGGKSRKADCSGGRRTEDSGDPGGKNDRKEEGSRKAATEKLTKEGAYFLLKRYGVHLQKEIEGARRAGSGNYNRVKNKSRC